MNIELNGKVYESTLVQNQFKNYVSYLEGVLKGNYRLSEAEISFLNIDEANIQTDVTQLLKNLKDFSPTSDYSNYDFNADGKINATDNEDIQLLSLILEGKFTDPGSIKKSQTEFYNKNSPNMPEDIKKIFEKPLVGSGGNKTDAVVKTEGGYYIAMNKLQAYIYDSDFNLVSLISGDPHVFEYDPETKKNSGYWNYGDDSVFILPDGTKLGLNSRQWAESSTSEKVCVFCGVYIKTDDTVLVYGSEYGANRDNSIMKDDTEGIFVNEVRDLKVDPEDWDADNVDTNQSKMRNGVFVLDEHTNHWLKLMEDGSFKDVKDDKSFQEYLDREGKDILVNNVEGNVTRDQYIATLDGKDRNNYSKLASSNFGAYKTTVENDFLLQRDKFTPEILNILNTVSKLNPGNFDYTKVYNDGLNDFQYNFLNFISTPSTTFSANPERDLLMKNYLFQKYFSETVPSIDLNSLTQADRDILNLAERLINTTVNKTHPYQDNINQIFNSFDSYKTDVEKLLSQVNFLECTKNLPEIGDKELENAFKTALGSGFFDTEGKSLEEALELLSGKQEQFISVLSSTINLNKDSSHTYYPASNKFLDKLYSAESFSIFKQTASTGTGTLNSASNRLSQMNKGGSTVITPTGNPTNNTAIQYMIDLLGEPDTDIDDLSDKAELLASLKDETTSQDRTDNINAAKSYYQNRITSYEEKIAELEKQMAQYLSYNSALAKKQIKNLQAKIYALNSEIQKTNKSISKLPLL